MKLLAFGASSSQSSINKTLAAYTANLLAENKVNTKLDVEVIDLNDFELPIFNTDLEKDLGTPVLAQSFFNKIGQADAIIISFAEHNGSYTAAYKNIFDWASRIDQKVFQHKPMVLLSTSPGAGGASNVLAAASGSAAYFSGDVKGTYSLKSFYDNFDLEKNIPKSEAIKTALIEVANTLLK
jgi:NAD(P)H-dependent FMN reductase